MAKFSKEMLIGDALRAANNQQAMAEVLFSVGMHCLGCALSKGETIEEAAAVHGIDPDELVKMLEEADKKI